MQLTAQGMRQMTTFQLMSVSIFKTAFNILTPNLFMFAGDRQKQKSETLVEQ
jgi:hypothetical protein